MAKCDADAVPSPTIIPAPRAFVRELLGKLWRFVKDECIPAEEGADAFLEAIGPAGSPARFSKDLPVLASLRRRARELGLWNVWADEHICALAVSRATNDSGVCGKALADEIRAELPPKPLVVSEYALLADVMGRSELAAIACNCSAPDTGNMELLSRFATPGQARRWLLPLLRAEIRSAFLMTEPHVASSDARNIACKIDIEGDGGTGSVATVTGRKWWATGACHPTCALFLVLGVSDMAATATQRHSIVLLPSGSPGVRDVKPLLVFGYDDAPFGHASLGLEAAAVGKSAPESAGQPTPSWVTRSDEEGATAPLLGGSAGHGRGMLMAQARLGPGRIHHCMRAVGLAERCLEALIVRAAQRVTFGRTLVGHGGVQRDIAECRIELDAARAMVMRSAAVLDEEASITAVDAKTAAIVAMGGASLSSRGRMAVATIKVLVPRIALRVMDRTIQVFGGAGVLGNGLAARAYAGMRCLRIADGPDDVHQRTIAGLEAIRVLGSKAGKAALRAKQRASKL